MNKPNCDFSISYTYEGMRGEFFFRQTEDPMVFMMLSINSIVLSQGGQDTSKWMRIKILENDTFLLKRSSDSFDDVEWFEDTDEDADGFAKAFWEGYSTWKLEQTMLT